MTMDDSTTTRRNPELRNSLCGNFGAHSTQLFVQFRPHCMPHAYLLHCPPLRLSLFLYLSVLPISSPPPLSLFLYLYLADLNSVRDSLDDLKLEL